MKVILVNGSPREKGCTYTALCEVAGALEKNGIETEIFQVGAKPIAGCIGCNVCLKNGRCFVDDRSMNLLRKQRRRTVLYSARRCIMRRHPVPSPRFSTAHSTEREMCLPESRGQQW